MQVVRGKTMGGISYTIKYTNTSTDYSKEIANILIEFNLVLSTYDSTSEISQFNRRGLYQAPSRYFREVWKQAKEVHQETGGAFDPTVMPLINAWGFGYKKVSVAPDSSTIDSLKQYVDMSAIRLSGKEIKSIKHGVGLDFSAIAKGYACDVIAEFLDSQDVDCYMVEIGGEVRCKGTKTDGDFWRIGVERPMEGGQSVLAAVPLENRSMATSGNYRNQRTFEGKKVGHTIDPRTGYPIMNHLKSATVFADNCMRADAFATAMMVLGVDQSIALAGKVSDIQVYLVYDDNGVLKTFASEGLKIEVQE